MGDSKHKDDARVKEVSKLLEAFFDRETLRSGGRYVAFVGAWRHLAGSHLADHSRPVDLKNGILIVGAEHPGWIQLLQMKQESILARVQSEYPDLQVRALAFRLADPREGGEPGPPAAKTQPEAPEPEPERREPRPVPTNLRSAPTQPRHEGSGTAASLPPELRAIFGRLRGKLHE